MKKQAETLFKEKFKKILEKEFPNAWFIKVQMVALRGIPDVLMSLQGRMVAMELKKNKYEKPDPLQLYTLEKIKKSGGVALVVHPENCAAVILRLQKLGKPR